MIFVEFEGLSILWNFCSSHANIFSLFYWLVLIQEERMLNHGNEFKNDIDLYNEEYKDLHLIHMKDEQSHAEMDMIIVNRIWHNTSNLSKSLNGLIFYQLYYQIFSYSSQHFFTFFQSKRTQNA